MIESELHTLLTWTEIGLAVVTFAALMWITAPYGRHYKGKGWGPQIPVRWGWVLMEMPAVAAFVGIYFTGQHALSLVPLIFLGVWQWHYVHRTFVYPLRLKAGDSKMPVMVAVLGACFNTLNAYINARWIGHFGEYGAAWLTDPRFGLGVLIFAVGFALNVHSDSVLFNLRAPGETGYKIPRRGAWRWVSSPNYLGELLEWTGWAVMTWSLPGLAFALYTASNLVPRAISNHRWYKETFSDYPAERKALLPFVF